MPRPSIEDKLRKVLREYLERAEFLSAEEAPLNTLAVAKALSVDRKTLKKYGLDAEVTASAKRQVQNARLSPRQIADRTTDVTVKELNRRIAEMSRRCDALLERWCLVEGNAQRMGIDPTELLRPLRLPNRALPHTGSSKSTDRPGRRRRKH
jgi:hypothetical protein